MKTKTPDYGMFTPAGNLAVHRMVERILKTNIHIHTAAVADMASVIHTLLGMQGRVISEKHAEVSDTEVRYAIVAKFKGIGIKLDPYEF